MVMIRPSVTGSLFMKEMNEAQKEPKTLEGLRYKFKHPVPWEVI